MSDVDKKDSKLKNAGVSGYNKPKRTPNHPTKSHVVVARNAKGETKTIRFGQQGVKGAGKNPKTAKDKARKEELLRQTQRSGFQAGHSERSLLVS